jgi:hypothetical protein
MASKWNSVKDRANGLIARMRGAPAYVALPLGVGFILGGTILAPLPIFGIWMVPVGLAILAPHWPGAARLSRRLYWLRLRALRWLIRHDFLRVKRVERPEDARQPSKLD